MKRRPDQPGILRPAFHSVRNVSAFCRAAYLWLADGVKAGIHHQRSVAPDEMSIVIINIIFFISSFCALRSKPRHADLCMAKLAHHWRRRPSTETHACHLRRPRLVCRGTKKISACVGALSSWHVYRCFFYLVAWRWLVARHSCDCAVLCDVFVAARIATIHSSAYKMKEVVQVSSIMKNTNWRDMSSNWLKHSPALCLCEQFCYAATRNEKF